MDKSSSMKLLVHFLLHLQSQFGLNILVGIWLLFFVSYIFPLFLNNFRLFLAQLASFLDLFLPRLSFSVLFKTNKKLGKIFIPNFFNLLHYCFVDKKLIVFQQNLFPNEITENARYNIEWDLTIGAGYYLI